MNCKFYVAVAAVGLLSMLTGCATSAERQGKAMLKNINAAVSDMRKCMGPVYQSEAFSPLRGYAQEGGKEMSLQQLSDNSMLTDEQKAALFAVHPLLKACRQAALDRISQTNPPFTQILADGMSTSEESLIDLVNRNQTWGAHNKRVKAAGELIQSRAIAEGQRIQAQLNLSNQQELEQRQTQRREAEQAVGRFAAATAAFALLALQEYANERQSQLNAAGPVYTHCYTIGESTNCTSR